MHTAGSKWLKGAGQYSTVNIRSVVCDFSWSLTSDKCRAVVSDNSSSVVSDNYKLVDKSRSVISLGQ